MSGAITDEIGNVTPPDWVTSPVKEVMAVGELSVRAETRTEVVPTVAVAASASDS